MSANDELLKRITDRPDVFGGKPIIRDLRVSVELVLSLLSQGVAPEASWKTTPTLNSMISGRALPTPTSSLQETPWPLFPLFRNPLAPTLDPILSGWGVSLALSLSKGRTGVALTKPPYPKMVECSR